MGAIMSAHSKPPEALPKLVGPIKVTGTSHAFLASDHLKRSIDLVNGGYIESEYLISGEAQVYEWQTRAGARVITRGPYTTRILVRRPKDSAHFNGTVIVEPLNPSSPVDLPIMWAQSYEQFMREGYAWVGITIKPNTIKSLKRFDPERYASLGMPHPVTSPRCAPADINPWAQPTTPDDETGLAWDILTQLGELLIPQSIQSTARSSAFT